MENSTERKLVIFIDSGDTLIDEGTEIRDGSGIVISAKALPGAEPALRTLAQEGYPLVLVADGYARSFRNVLTQNGLYGYFSAVICSELMRTCKPDARMFRAAMGAFALGDGDRSRIVMLGNNLARDVAGANRAGITSIWLDWSPRYPHQPRSAEEQPDYTLHTLPELPPLVRKLEEKLRKSGALK